MFLFGIIISRYNCCVVIWDYEIIEFVGILDKIMSIFGLFIIMDVKFCDDLICY